MADIQAIYSGHSAAPMESNIDELHQEVCQKILGLPREGNGSRPTFTLLEKQRYNQIRQRANAAYQCYPIDDAIYGLSPLPPPTSSVPKDGECINIED